MADAFDPEEQFGTVHWADEEDKGHEPTTTRKRSRTRSATPSAQDHKYKSFVKETAGVTSEDWQNLHPALKMHVDHNQDAGHKISSQVTLDCEHNHQSTVTADMTNHMLETWAKKGVELNGDTQKTLILCNRPGYRQGMVVSCKPEESKDWHYIIYEFDPPPTQTTDAIYQAFRNQFNHPPDAVYHVTEASNLPSQANTLYKRHKFHAHYDSPQTQELHDQFVAVTKKAKAEKEKLPHKPPNTPRPPILKKVQFGGDIPSLPPMPEPVIPQMYPQNSSGGGVGGGGDGGLGGFFTNQLNCLIQKV